MDPPGSRIPLPDFFPPQSDTEEEEEKMDVVKPISASTIETMQETIVSDTHQAEANDCKGAGHQENRMLLTSTHTTQEDRGGNIPIATSFANEIDIDEFIESQMFGIEHQESRIEASAKDISGRRNSTTSFSSLKRGLRRTPDQLEEKRRSSYSSMRRIRRSSYYSTDTFTGSTGLTRGLQRTREELEAKQRTSRRVSFGQTSTEHSSANKSFRRGLQRSAQELEAKKQSRSVRLHAQGMPEPPSISDEGPANGESTKGFQRGLHRSSEELGAKRKNWSRSFRTQGVPEPPGVSNERSTNYESTKGLQKRSRRSSKEMEDVTSRLEDGLESGILEEERIADRFPEHHLGSDEDPTEEEIVGAFGVRTHQGALEFTPAGADQSHYPSETGISQPRDLGNAQQHLAVATPVADTHDRASLPRAREWVSRAQQQGFTKTTYRCAIFCGLVSCAIAIMVVLIVVRSVSKADSSSTSTKIADNPERSNFDPIKESPKEYVLSLLPQYSLQAMENDPDSPQAKALEWAILDPSLADYEPWRVLQRFALVTIYHSTDGSAWTQKKDWLSYTASEYDWYSDLAFIENGSFVSIPRYLKDLLIDAMSAAGPAELEDSQGLTHLWLGSNKLRGTIPPEIALLTDLWTLDFSSNQLSGSLPSQIGQLQHLELMSLFVNQLEGTLPTEVGFLSGLKLMFLYHNRFSGALPTEMGLMDPFVVHMQQCKFSGTLPSELGQQTNIMGLLLYQNVLTGTIPSQIGLMTSLNVFESDNNRFTGTIPSQLAELNSRQDLSLYVEFANERFFGLGDMVGEAFNDMFVKGLTLHNNLITGTVPRQLEKWTTANFLSLYSNFMTGTVPTELGNMQDLTTLLLHDNNFVGSIPKHFGALKKLRALAMSQNQLIGSIPSEYTSIVELNALLLQDNALTGTVPSFGNQFASDEPTEILWQRDFLGAELDLSRNLLNGTIPDNLVGPKLIRLGLEGNRLTGPLPPSLGNDGWLKEVNLGGNLLQGTIPASLCGLNSSSTLISLCEDLLCGCECKCS